MSQNKGSFIPTTPVLDVQTIYDTDVNSKQFKEFIVRIVQYLSQMANSLNSKTSGSYNTNEVASGETFFPNPTNTSATATFASPRPIFRYVCNFGALPNSTSKSVAHGLTLASTFTTVKISGGATNSTGTSFIPLPYVSLSGAGVEVSIDSTNVTITTGSDRSSYTGYVIFEYLKN